jgi:hypothetical protein
MSDLLEKTEYVESLINKELGEQFDLVRAQLYSVIEEGEGVSMTLAGEGGDVYELLEREDTAFVAKVSDYMVVLTCGWASPIAKDDDEAEAVAPSQHPQRRRVRLVIMANRQGFASVMRFGDDAENTVTDDGQARGSLADALNELFVVADAL